MCRPCSGKQVTHGRITMARVRQKNRGADGEEGRDTRRGWILGGLLLVLVLAIVGMVLLTRDDGAVASGQYEGIAIQGRLLGDPDAPILVREFLDFKCPHCRDASRDLVPQVIEAYVKEGQAKIEFIPVAFNAQSLPGAEASLCAEEQGSFMAYHDLLFANQDDPFDIAMLTRLAGRAGMDEEQFRACLGSGKYRQQVQANLADFQQAGANSTPTFFVNEVPVIGAVPFEELAAEIDGQLTP